MSEAARSYRPDRAVEPPIGRAPGEPRPADPLAELARLVGQEDPFRAMFRPGAAPAPASPPMPASVPPLMPPPVPTAPRQTSTTPASSPASAAEAEAQWADAHYDESGPHAAAPVASAYDAPAHDPREYDPREREPRSHDDTGAGWHHGEAPVEDWQHQDGAEAGHGPAHPDAADTEPHHFAPVAEGEDHDAIAAAPVAPDLWAVEPAAMAQPEFLADETAGPNRAPRRPLVVLFAVLALTGGGLAATFLARSGASVAATGGRGTPTILASSAPTKVQQVDTATATSVEDAESALVSRNGETNSGPVKVINSQEQPLDLAQLPKSAGSEANGGPASQSPFPEPRRVKTFLVRPDGSMIPASGAGAGAGASAPAAPSAPNSLPQLASLLPMGASPDPAPAPTTPAARPATPKSATHAPTTPTGPKAAPTTIGDLAAEATNTAVAKPRQAAAPGPKAKPRPVEIADAGASDAAPASSPTSAPSSGGGFALQLAASPTELEARDAFSRLQKKYSELGGYKASIRRAESGDKSVFRLRVGGMSQDQAKNLCAQLQASGGSCFVVHN